MFKNIKNLFFSIIFFTFIFMIIQHYFSKENIKKTNKSRSTYSVENTEDLPLLINDTDDVIIYTDELKNFEKKRKKRIWEKLISDD